MKIKNIFSEIIIHYFWFKMHLVLHDKVYMAEFFIVDYCCSLLFTGMVITFYQILEYLFLILCVFISYLKFQKNSEKFQKISE